MFQQAIVAASRVFRIIDEKEVAPHQESNQNLQIKNGEIEFRNVSFFHMMGDVMY